MAGWLARKEELVAMHQRAGAQRTAPRRSRQAENSSLVKRSHHRQQRLAALGLSRRFCGLLSLSLDFCCCLCRVCVRLRLQFFVGERMQVKSVQNHYTKKKKYAREREREKLNEALKDRFLTSHTPSQSACLSVSLSSTFEAAAAATARHANHRLFCALACPFRLPFSRCRRRQTVSTRSAMRMLSLSLSLSLSPNTMKWWC